MRRNKKGQFLMGAPVDGYAYIIIILVLVLFFLLFKFSASVRSARIDPPSLEVASSQAILAYLRMPVEVGRYTMTMAELIALGMTDGDFEDSMEEQTQNFLESISGEDECYYIMLGTGYLESELFRSRVECYASVNELGARLVRSVYNIVDLIAEEEILEAFSDISSQYRALIPPLDPNAAPIPVFLYAGVKDE